MNELSNEGRKAERAKRHFLSVWTAVGAILLAGVFIYLLNILSVPVGIIIWTIVIVFCLRGPVDWLEKKGVNRTVGTALAYVLLFVVLGVVLLLLFSPAFGLGGQFSDLVQNVPVYAQSIIDWANGIYAQYSHLFEDEIVHQWITDAQSALLSWTSSLARDSAAGVVAVGSAIINGFVAVGFALVVAFWILMELPALGRECLRLANPKHHDDLHMFHVTFTRVMGGYIKGTLLQCAIIGVACGVLFGVVGIPNYAALGGITGLLNIIPIIGPWLGGALAALVGIFVSPWAALFALVGTIAIQQIVYTFVSPRIMANSVDVHPAFTIIALMAGSAIGGAMNGLMGALVGMLASIPAVAVAKSVFVYYFEKHTGRCIVASDGVFFKGTPTAKEGEKVDPIADATSSHLSLSVLAGRSKRGRNDAEKHKTEAATEHDKGAAGRGTEDVKSDPATAAERDPGAAGRGTEDAKSDSATAAKRDNQDD